MGITPFNMVRDINGFNGFGRVPSNTVFRTTLSANVEQHFTVPNITDANYKYLLAVFEQDPGSAIFVAVNGTATLPGGSFSQGIGEENPGAFRVNSGDTISAITGDATNYFCVAFYVSN